MVNTGSRKPYSFTSAGARPAIDRIIRHRCAIPARLEGMPRFSAWEATSASQCPSVSSSTMCIEILMRHNGLEELMRQASCPVSFAWQKTLSCVPQLAMRCIFSFSNDKLTILRQFKAAVGLVERGIALAKTKPGRGVPANQVLENTPIRSVLPGLCRPAWDTFCPVNQGTGPYPWVMHPA